MEQEQEPQPQPQPIPVFRLSSIQKYIFHDNEIFKAIVPVGSANNGRTPVVLYESSVTGNNVVAKIERLDDDLVQVEFDRSQVIPPFNTILGIQKQFLVDELQRCVIIPYMGEGSLRHIIWDKYETGLSGDNALKPILRCVLDALERIHDRGEVHKELSAGHVFLNTEGVVKLAFGTTVYDDDDYVFQSHEVHWGALLTITTWATAPEIYGIENAVHTNKSDLWLFGVLALEVIYGGKFLIKFRERAKFDELISDIRSERKLPKKVLDREGPLIFRQNKEKCPFNPRLEEMLIKCFEANPDRRPTAKQFKTSIKMANPLYILDEVINPKRLKDPDDDDDAAAKARMLQMS